MATTNGLDVDRRALRGIVRVVQVVERAAQALVPHCITTDGERAVGADGEPRGVDGASLWWVVELELLIGRDVASAALRIHENTIVEGDDERGMLSLLMKVSHIQ